MKSALNCIIGGMIVGMIIAVPTILFKGDKAPQSADRSLLEQRFKIMSSYGVVEVSQLAPHTADSVDVDTLWGVRYVAVPAIDFKADSTHELAYLEGSTLYVSDKHSLDAEDILRTLSHHLTHMCTGDDTCDTAHQVSGDVCNMYMELPLEDPVTSTVSFELNIYELKKEASNG